MLSCAFLQVAGWFLLLCRVCVRPLPPAMCLTVCWLHAQHTSLIDPFLHNALTIRQRVCVCDIEAGGAAHLHTWLLCLITKYTSR